MPFEMKPKPEEKLGQDENANPFRNKEKVSSETSSFFT